MARRKNSDKAISEVADKVTSVIEALKRLRKQGVNNAAHLNDNNIHKMKISLEREVQATVDAIQYEQQLTTGKIKENPFKF